MEGKMTIRLKVTKNNPYFNSNKLSQNLIMSINIDNFLIKIQI